MIVLKDLHWLLTSSARLLRIRIVGSRNRFYLCIRSSYRYDRGIICHSTIKTIVIIAKFQCRKNKKKKLPANPSWKKKTFSFFFSHASSSVGWLNLLLEQNTPKKECPHVFHSWNRCVVSILSRKNQARVSEWTTWSLSSAILWLNLKNTDCRILFSFFFRNHFRRKQMKTFFFFIEIFNWFVFFFAPSQKLHFP